MKQCPRCLQTYSDDQLNFCLEDGDLLRDFFQERPSRFADDSPPTVVMKDARRTNPTNWPATPPTPFQQNQMQFRASAPFAWTRSQNQTVPTVALVLGILSVVMSCCYGGIWLGLPAIILGFIGLRNANNDAANYGGRGMAIWAMAMGIVALAVSLLIVIFAIIAS